jgi:hypothetical protein
MTFIKFWKSNTTLNDGFVSNWGIGIVYPAI